MTKTRRIFFALWPDDDTRQAIATTFKESSADLNSGRIMQPSNLHLTLHFIGHVSEEKLHCLDQQARKIHTNKFNTIIDHYDYFSKKKIIWMGLKEKPSSLGDLHRKLAKEFVECGYHADNHDYTPHITVARKANKPAEPGIFESIKWQVKEFVLVESLQKDNHVEYKVIQQYPLT